MLFFRFHQESLFCQSESGFSLDLVRIIAARRGEKVTRTNDFGNNENQNNLFGFLEGRGARASRLCATHDSVIPMGSL
jgi:hypothetical protein